MSEQNDSRSAFIESMRQTRFYTEWVKTAALVKEENEMDHLSDELINTCRQNAEKVSYISGSYVKMSREIIYIFTIWVDKEREEWDKEYSHEIQKLLSSLKKSENVLESVAVKLIDEIGFEEVYYLRLVFKRGEEPDSI